MDDFERLIGVAWQEEPSARAFVAIETEDEIKVYAVPLSVVNNTLKESTGDAPLQPGLMSVAYARIYRDGSAEFGLMHRLSPGSVGSN